VKADLHIHTTFSDGELTPREVARRAKAAGLSAFAITDHDECRGFGELEKTDGVTAIAGIELAAEFDGELHVLGLHIDCSNEALIAHVEKAANSRFTRACEIIERLNRDGMAISIDEVKEVCGGDVIGRPHIAAVLVKKGLAESVGDAFDRYLSSRAPYYVAQKKITVSRAAEMILGAGGKPVLAHPGLLSGSVYNNLMPQIKEMGFWGIEAYHPAHTDGQCIEYESAARQMGLFVTAGSDFHGSSTPRVGIGEEIRSSYYLEESVLILINESEKRS
jgi:predicted metal-dependent phosphoesterase TrpH